MVAQTQFFGGCVFLFISSLIASAGGIGGGGINVPILILVFNFSFKAAAKFSYFVVLGNVLSQACINVSKRHPYQNAFPLIYWELVALLLPTQIAGTTLGSLLGSILPDIALYILALIVLVFASSFSLLKGIKKHKEEHEFLISRQSQIGIESSTNLNPLSPDSSSLHNDTSNSTSSGIDKLSINEESNGVLPKLIIPKPLLYAIFSMWTVYVCLSVVYVRQKKCSTVFLVVFFLLFFPLIICICFVAYYEKNYNMDGSLRKSSISHTDVTGWNAYLRTSDLLRPSVSLPPDFNKDAIIGTSSNMSNVDLGQYRIILPLVTFCIGILCALLGIGGGELLSPLMLGIQVLPLVVSASSPILSLLTTGANVIRTLSEPGFDSYSTSALFFVTGLLGGSIGRGFGFYVATKYHRSSILIFALVLGLYLSCIYYIYELSTEKLSSSVETIC